MIATIAEVYALIEGIPAGAWVAVSTERHEVMAFGIDSQAVMEEARSKGEDDPLLVRVPEQEMLMIL